MIRSSSTPYTNKELLQILSGKLKGREIYNLHLALSLLSHSTNQTKQEILSNPDKVISKKHTINALKSAELIKKDFPVSYIIRNIDFFGINYFITENTLIPRPETELLVESAINFLENKNIKKEVLHCLEIGTGSGCISISILKMLERNKGIYFVLTDKSYKAISVAKFNAKNILSADTLARVKFKRQDLFKEYPKGKFDLIVSNPPYIPIDEYNLLPKSLKYEPRMALTDNSDGLSFYRSLAELISEKLNPNGKAFIEIHANKSREIKSIFTETCSKKALLKIHKDIFGRKRLAEISLN